MINSTSESTIATLVCAECEDTKQITLDRNLFEELGRQGEVRIFCGVCEKRTCWSCVQTDRRSGFERRRSPLARLELPISIRCSHPVLQFTELTTTLTASGRGASFFTRHPLRERMTLEVGLSLKGADPNSSESPARVVWVGMRDEGWVAGVELQGERPGADRGVTQS